jgi:D-lactate dehydrogenase
MSRIHFYEAFEEEQQLLRALMPPGLEATYTDATIQEAGDVSPPAGLISIRTQSVIPPLWADALEGILSRSAGYDHLSAYLRDTATALPCGYLPRYCQRAVAEQALLLWLALLRRLPRQQAQVRTFHRDGLTGTECAGRNLMVVGVGNIGYEIYGLGRDIGMRVQGVDLEQKHEDVCYVKPIDGARDADVIVCAMNLTADNHAYFDRDFFSHCTGHPVFVNIARGEMSPPQELLHCLDTGLLGGVGLDVYEDEPLLAAALRSKQPTAHDAPEVLGTVRQLLERDNVILTPHNAFNTEESVQRKAEQSVAQVCQFLETGHFKWHIPG